MSNYVSIYRVKYSGLVGKDDGHMSFDNTYALPGDLSMEEKIGYLRGFMEKSIKEVEILSMEFLMEAILL